MRVGAPLCNSRCLWSRKPIADDSRSRRQLSIKLVLNLKATKTLGVEIPPPLFSTADEVIDRIGDFSLWHVANMV
jgi:hypothetical protein